jgi:hypothetical protein
MPWKEFNDTTLLEIDCHKNWEYYTYNYRCLDEITVVII